MIYDFYPRGDDTFYYRLFSLLENKIPAKIVEVIRIRNDVYLVKTNQFWLIVKAYGSYQKLKIQEAFTRNLKKEGFTKTYQFYEFDIEPVILDGKVYGMMEYIPPHKVPFTYENKRNRGAALQLLEKYYSVTEQIVEIYKYVLPIYPFIKKWEHRLEEFRGNKSIIEHYIKKDMVYEIIDWAESSLHYAKTVDGYLETKSNVILHGDVAHHNFLRSVDNTLYLIDFDLISIGPKEVDYLQFANRILPHIGWSFQQLQKMQGYSYFLQDEWFINALLYPTDIMREWNRIIRNNDENDFLLEQVMFLTADQYQSRRNFNQKLRQIVDS